MTIVSCADEGSARVMAVDEVRRREHFQMHLAGKDTLKGTRRLWLYDLQNVPRK